MREPEVWRRLPVDNGSPVDHIAQSDALARVSTEPTIWWHSSREPVLILGAGQSSADLDLGAVRAAGVSVVRRASGGTAVFAAQGLIGLDVALPTSHSLVNGDVVESYAWFGTAWAAAMTGLGGEVRSVELAEARRVAHTSSSSLKGVAAACFGTISPYEVVSGTRKLVGLSQVRRRRAQVLQSGVYLEFSASTLANLLVGGDKATAGAALADAAVGLNEVVGRRVAPEEVREAFEHVLSTQYGIQVRDADWTDEERLHVKEYVLQPVL